jgi:hypothetical protein
MTPKKGFILSIVTAAILFSCNEDQDIKLQGGPLDQLQQVDDLLSEIANKRQILNAPSNQMTTVKGARGTIIHVDPNQLETVDGSRIGELIQIELLEMTDISSMLTNNSQTLSNGKILITGGAYYLNMTSDGKQLRMKQGLGLKVEFPQLTEYEMFLFLGEKDSLGQINWKTTENRFKPKNIEGDETTISEDSIKEDTTYGGSGYGIRKLVESDILVAPKPVNPETVSKEEYQNYLRKKKDYEVQQKQRKYQRKTYQAIELMNFGWINCDRFWKNSNPKIDIQLLVNNDSLSGARFYAVFKDINSIMTASYWKSRTDTVAFRNIPKGQELTIIALSANEETPYIFERTINTETDKQVQIEFIATTQDEIKEKLKRMN